MNKHIYGYRCSVVFDGIKYVVTRLRDVTNSFAFYPAELDHKVKIRKNPDQDDPFSYCRSKHGTYTLTLPADLAKLIKKNK